MASQGRSLGRKLFWRILLKTPQLTIFELSPHRSCAFGALAARTRTFIPGLHFLDARGTAGVSQQRQGPPPGSRPPLARADRTTDAAARGGVARRRPGRSPRFKAPRAPRCGASASAPEHRHGRCQPAAPRPPSRTPAAPRSYRQNDRRHCSRGRCSSPSGPIPALQSPKSPLLRCLSERPCQKARPMSVSSAEAPLQPPAAPRPHSPHDRRRCSRGRCSSPSGPIPALRSTKISPLRCLSERPCQQARPMSTSSAKAPLQAPGCPSPALTTRPTPPLEGALLVANRADPRASTPQELSVAVPKRSPL